MAALSAAKRLARLGWWVGLSTGAMVAAACGAMFASACKSSSSASDGGQPDAAVAAQKDAPVINIPMPDASAREAGAPTDASEADLWNTICE
jgi:hypothetical protein